MRWNVHDKIECKVIDNNILVQFIYKMNQYHY